MDKLKQNARVRCAFSDYLTAQRLRCTPERMQVLDVVLSLRGHFTAGQLVEECASRSELNVSRATVFNVLPLMERAGVIRRLAHDRMVSYETVRHGVQLKARQHLVCSKCGRIQRLQAPLLGAWVEHQSYRDFTPMAESAVLYVYGLCNKCRRRTRIATETGNSTGNIKQ